MKDFALIGAAGYIAPKHLSAIKATGNQLVAALDISDSAGILDNFFPCTSFFTEFERFDRHLEKIRRKGAGIDYLSICSPNYLHDSHIRFGLRQGADVICEKPLVLNPWNVDALLQLRQETGREVYNILQMRFHPEIIRLKEEVEAGAQSMYDIDLTYISARGKWYYASWKADQSKSGGIATNIGIHFFDLLTWIFGKVKTNIVHIHTHDRAAGFLELEKARIRWFLSINEETLPPGIRSEKKRIYRSLKIGSREINLAEGVTDLHIKSYEAILGKEGLSLEVALPSIELVHNIRTQKPCGLTGDYHELAKLPLTQHPFNR